MFCLKELLCDALDSSLENFSHFFLRYPESRTLWFDVDYYSSTRVNQLSTVGA